MGSLGGVGSRIKKLAQRLDDRERRKEEQRTVRTWVDLMQVSEKPPSAKAVKRFGRGPYRFSADWLPIIQSARERRRHAQDEGEDE